MTKQFSSYIDLQDVRCLDLLARFRLFRKFKASVIRGEFVLTLTFMNTFFRDL